MPEYTFQYAVTLIDSRSIKSTLRFRRVIDDISVVAAFTTAEVEAADLLTDLQAVTDAALYRASLSYLQQVGEAIPAPGVADVTDEAAVSVWLSDVGALPKYGQLRIPAPIDMWETDEITVDKSNAALINYVANFGPAKWEVSDGEPVIVSRDNGIANGHYRSRAKSTAKGA